MSRITALLIAFPLLLVLAGAPAAARQAGNPLVIAVSNDFHPFTFLNSAGEPAGLFVDIWRLWAKKNGRDVTFLVSDWKTSLENLKNGRADIHSGLIRSLGRISWMADVRPFYRSDVRCFLPRQQLALVSLESLVGKTIGVVRGGEPEEYLQRNQPQIKLISVSSRDELPLLARNGLAAGFVAIGNVGRSLIDRQGLSGYFDIGGLVLYEEDFQPGVLKGNKELVALVERGMQALTPAELADIEARWIADPAMRHLKGHERIRLSPLEERWLKAHPVVRVGMSPVLQPLKFLENGVIKGLEPDYLREIAEMTGIRFEMVTLPFTEMDGRVKNGELDMFLSFNIPERLGYMTFTEPFADFRQVVVGRNDIPFISSIAELKGRRVATIRGVKLQEKLLAPYPEIQKVPCNTMDDAFRALTDRKADALISKTLFVGYLLDKFPRLKVAGVLDLPPEPYLYAVRKDFPELVSILNRAILAIPRERHDSIRQKWQSVRLDYRPDWKETLKWVAITGSACFIILAFVFISYRRVQQARLRQKDAEAQLSEHCARESHLEDLAAIREQVEEEERSRLARELHDSSGQSLQAIRLNLNLLASALESECNCDGRNVAQELRLLSCEVGATAGELREISHMVRPSFLREMALDEAVSVRCGQMQRRKVPLFFSCTGNFKDLPFNVSDNIYRIFQEAVANAVRHSGADRIGVELTRIGAGLRLLVSDDGCGIGESVAGEGIGLKIMAERAAIIGATLSVSSEGKGTTVTMMMEGL